MAAESRATSVAAWRYCSSRPAARTASSFFNSSFSDAGESARDAVVRGEPAGLASPASAGAVTLRSQGRQARNVLRLFR